MAEFISGADGKGYRIQLNVDLVSQSINDNTSTYRFRLYLISKGYSFAQYAASASITFDGGRRIDWSEGSSAIGLNQTRLLIDQTHTIWHDNSGNKWFGVMASFNSGGGWAPSSLGIGEQRITPPSIARASTVGDLSATIGTIVNFKIEPKNESYTHKVRYLFGNASGVIGENLKKDVTWNIPTSLLTEIPTSAVGNGTLFVDTYNNGSLIGTNTSRLTLSISSNTKPKAGTLKLSENNVLLKDKLKDSPNTFIQILSNIRCEFTGSSGNGGSTITAYHFEIVGKNMALNTNGGVFGPMNFSGDYTINGYVVDSRGARSDTVSQKITIIPYFSPSIVLTAQRSGANMDIITTSTTVSTQPVIINGKNINEYTVTFSTAQMSGEKVGVFSPNNGPANFGSSTTPSVTNRLANLAGTYASDKSFMIRATIKDSYSPKVEYDVPVGTESVVVEYDRGGVAIGKIREKYNVEAIGDISTKGVYRIGDKPIQNMPLTNTDGGYKNSLMGWTWFIPDLNDITEPGQYIFINNSGKNSNQPINGVGIITHVGNDKEAVQYYYAKDSSRLFVRSCSAGTWRKWVEFAPTTHKNLLYQEWTPVPNTEVGAKFKRVGDIVYVMCNHRADRDGDFAIGRFPSEWFTNIKQSVMITVANWSVDGSSNIHIQLNNDGGCAVLSPGKGVVISVQFSFAI